MLEMVTLLLLSREGIYHAKLAMTRDFDVGLFGVYTVPALVQPSNTEDLSTSVVLYLKQTLKY